jgi:hypothetical protein
MLGLFAGSGPSRAAPVSASDAAPHVFLIVLENQDYDASFGSGSKARYLSGPLRRQGALLSRYYGIAHHSLGNYIALISGQGPNPSTQMDCGRFVDFQARSPALDADGQAMGTGCVYPRWVPTLADQLEAAGLSWRGYMLDMGDDPAREAAHCGHPAIGTADRTQHASAMDQYAARHNPFVYFHSIIDDRARCDRHVVNLDDLAADLREAARTPNFALIVPDLCNDGHDAVCANGTPGGLPRADAFLQRWVARILASPAFKENGMLIVTFDESAAIAGGDQACCGEAAHPGPNTAKPGIGSAGGGRIGALVISDRHVRPGTLSERPYNHYSLLRSVEDLFGLRPLGFAGLAQVQPFGDDVFTRRSPYPPAPDPERR